MSPKATAPQRPLILKNYHAFLVVLVLQPRTIKTTISFQHYVIELLLITKINANDGNVSQPLMGQA